MLQTMSNLTLTGLPRHPISSRHNAGISSDRLAAEPEKELLGSAMDTLRAKVWSLTGATETDGAPAAADPDAHVAPAADEASSNTCETDIEACDAAVSAGGTASANFIFTKNVKFTTRTRPTRDAYDGKNVSAENETIAKGVAVESAYTAKYNLVQSAYACIDSAAENDPYAKDVSVDNAYAANDTAVENAHP